MGLRLSAAMSINRRLNNRFRPKNCHGCTDEWGDACDKRKVHLPANKPRCRDCNRNPKPEKQPTFDRYVPLEQVINEMAEAYAGVQYESDFDTGRVEKPRGRPKL